MSTKSDTIFKALQEDLKLVDLSVNCPAGCRGCTCRIEPVCTHCLNHVFESNGND